MSRQQKNDRVSEKTGMEGQHFCLLQNIHKRAANNAVNIMSEKGCYRDGIRTCLCRRKYNEL